ncbi:hypothetical protein FRB90_004925 [Tulasnella sp. 427]|nr:hypothetical protein FRB90_004925 [Tulasnella sp. 427]
MHRVKLKKPDSITLSRSNYYDKERILNPASTTPSSDIYGLGCIMLFTMTGKEPFFKLTNPARVIVSIYQGRTPEPEDYPQLPKEDQLWNLMHKCWSAEPSARPSSSQVIYKINLIMDIGSGLTGPIVLPHVDATAETPILSPSDESIIQPGVSVPALPPPLSGDLIKIEYIGGGGYGDVHRGHWTIPGKAPVPVAIKSIRSSRANDLTIEQNQAFLLRRIRRETVIWKAAEHPNVLPFHGYQIADDIPMLVSPWFKNGNLWSYLGLHAELNDFQRLKLLRGAARGLAHLHALEPPICHGDIKPQNVIINDDLEAILCDFGISRVMTSLVGTGMTTFGTATGTHGYQAKELFEPESRTTDKSDVYAFGGLVLATMSRQRPSNTIRNSLKV